MSVMFGRVLMIGYEMPHHWQVSQSSHGEVCKECTVQYITDQAIFSVQKTPTREALTDSQWCHASGRAQSENAAGQRAMIFVPIRTQCIRVCHRIPAKLFINDGASMGFKRIACRLCCPPKTMLNFKWTNSTIREWTFTTRDTDIQTHW